MSTLELFTCYWFVPSLITLLLVIWTERTEEGRGPDGFNELEWLWFLILAAIWPVGYFSSLTLFLERHKLFYRLWTALTKERGGKK